MDTVEPQEGIEVAHEADLSNVSLAESANSCLRSGDEVVEAVDRAAIECTAKEPANFIDHDSDSRNANTDECLQRESGQTHVEPDENLVSSDIVRFDADALSEISDVESDILSDTGDLEDETPEPLPASDLPKPKVLDLEEISDEENVDYEYSPKNSPDNFNRINDLATHGSESLMIRDTDLDFEADIETVSRDVDHLNVRDAEESVPKADAEEGECDSDKEGGGGDEAKQVELDVDDGEVLSAEDLEEGECSNDEDNSLHPSNKPLCKFFTRGNCTWGQNCRFLHPGAPETGNYSMFDPPQPLDAINNIPFDRRPPPNAQEKPIEWGPALAERLGGIPPSEEPQPESAWEIGLRHAKELVKRAIKRREEDIDFEEKRMNLGLGQEDLDKENDYYTKPASPVYDRANHDALFGLDAPVVPSHWRPPVAPPAGAHPVEVRIVRQQDPRNIDFIKQRQQEKELELQRAANDRLSRELYEKRRKDREVVKEIRNQGDIAPQTVPEKRWKDERVEDVKPQLRRADDWADPWMRSKLSPSVGGKKTRRRESVSSGSSYSSSGSSSRSHSRSSSSSSKSSYSSRSSRSRSPSPRSKYKREKPALLSAIRTGSTMALAKKVSTPLASKILPHLKTMAAAAPTQNGSNANTLSSGQQVKSTLPENINPSSLQQAPKPKHDFPPTFANPSAPSPPSTPLLQRAPSKASSGLAARLGMAPEPPPRPHDPHKPQSHPHIPSKALEQTVKAAVSTASKPDPNLQSKILSVLQTSVQNVTKALQARGTLNVSSGKITLPLSSPPAAAPKVIPRAALPSSKATLPSKVLSRKSRSPSTSSSGSRSRSGSRSSSGSRSRSSSGSSSSRSPRENFSRRTITAGGGAMSVSRPKQVQPVPPPQGLPQQSPKVKTVSAGNVAPPPQLSNQQKQAIKLTLKQPTQPQPHSALTQASSALKGLMEKQDEYAELVAKKSLADKVVVTPVVKKRPATSPLPPQQPPKQPAPVTVPTPVPTPVISKTPKKSTLSRREELLKQLKAVEDAIARKRSKLPS